MKGQNIKNIIKSAKNSSAWLKLLRAAVSILLAVVLCSGIALSVVFYLKINDKLSLDKAHFDDGKIRIYIDQGHNPSPYHNSGAEGNGLYEQDLTFSIGCLLADMLREDGRFEVCLSRPEESTVLGTDISSSLSARVSGAKAFGADYFISLHINSYTADTVNGLEVFVSGGDGESYAFGSSMLQGMIDSTKLKSRGMKFSSELYVLKNSDMPAALLEMGFISNSDDAELLSQEPELFAKGIYDGIVEHFESKYTQDINILLWTIVISTAIGGILIAITIVIEKKRRAVSEEPVLSADDLK